MTTTLTRRGFVARGGAALAALSFPALAAARRAAPKTVAIYRLDPHSEHCGGGVGSCKACAAYAGRSFFPTAKAAAGNRAHPGCDCCVIAGTIDYGSYVALFGNPRDLTRYRADTRDRRTQAILKQHPPRFASK
jgi:hypothetical protein